MDEKLKDMNVVDLVELYSKTDDDAVAKAVVAELEGRLADDPENTAVAAAVREVGGTVPEPQAGAGEPSGGRAQGEQTWLVQRTDLIDIEPDDPRVVWVDVGEVAVPPRTKRRTIVEKALAMYPDATPGKDGGGAQFRVLDSDSSAEIPVRWEVPPAPEPELRIG